jgi:hypothetical protein
VSGCSWGCGGGPRSVGRQRPVGMQLPVWPCQAAVESGPSCRLHSALPFVPSPARCTGWLPAGARSPSPPLPPLTWPPHITQGALLPAA